jgi:hypothetical protein
LLFVEYTIFFAKSQRGFGAFPLFLERKADMPSGTGIIEPA